MDGEGARSTGDRVGTASREELEGGDVRDDEKIGVTEGLKSLGVDAVVLLIDEEVMLASDGS